MKRKSIVFLTAIIFLLSGCFVVSFYPLYTPEDLFPNDLLLGEWLDEDSTIWKFKHKPIGKIEDGKVDSTTYILKIKEEKETEFKDESLYVRLVKLENHYFLDFYLKDYGSDDGGIFDAHVIRVHSFAKLKMNDGQLSFSWLDPEWLSKLLEQNKIRIHHEKNDDQILLTAKPKELQKFMIKYVNSEEAFEDELILRQQ